MSVTVTTITQSGGSGATHRSRPSFHYNGRYWIVYYHSGALRFRSSTNGTSWSGATTIVTRAGNNFAICFDGTYMHYVQGEATNKADTFYRRGAPQSNGTITWSAAEQNAYNHSTGFGRYFSINVDTSGYAYISYTYSYSGLHGCYVLKSSNNDGTWGSGTSYTISAANYSSSHELCQLSGGEMYIVYHKSSVAGIYGKLYSSGSWGSETTVTTSIYSHGWLSAVADADDDVHCSYMGPASSYHIHHRKWTYGVPGSWGGEETIKGGTNSYEGYEAGNLAVDPDTGFLYHFRASEANDWLYWTKRTTSWDSPVTWIYEGTDTLDYPDNVSIHAYRNKMNGEFAVSYQTKTASPWNLKHAILTLGWGHKINTVEGPAAVNTIPGADIAAINTIEA